jgi:hypothetical protein
MESNRDLLKEAIADAKAVKETALAQAKVALEEAFTPFLKETLATRIAALDEVDEVDENMYEEENMEEGEYMEGDDMMDEGDDMMDEELDLEALLAELEDGEEVEEQLFEAEGEDEEVEDEEFNIEDMSEEDLKGFIEDVIGDMVAAGELEGGHPGMEEEPGMEDEMGMEGEEEINIDELLAEVSKEKAMKEKMKAMRDKKKSAPKKDDEDEKLKEAYDVIRTLKGELNEINLLNAKLLYTNKIFKAKSLTESEKVKVLSAFDKATNVKEVKLVYESLSMNSAKPKSNIKESLGSASKVMSPQAKQPIIEVNDAFSRMQKLAGLK